jgi:GntR family trehalose operon transcriptional repressor
VKAIYGGIYRDLRDKVVSGDFPFQSLLPSEANLVREYGCSHNTLRKALGLLTDQGYVHPIQGKGVRVIYQPQDKALFSLGGIETFKETAERNHLKATTVVETFERIHADERVSAKTGFAKGTRLWHVERVRLLDGKALILDRNYFSIDLVPDLTEEDVARSAYEYIEGTLGMRIATSKRTVTVERTTKEDERLLDADDFDFLAVVSGQTFNGDGLMFEYTQSRHRPDYFTFHTTAIRGR